MTTAALSDALREALEALALVDPANPSDAAARLRALVAALNGTGPLDAQVLRTTATRILTERQVPDARRLVDAAFLERNGKGLGEGPDLQGQAVAFADPELWPEPVDGADLLRRLQMLVGRFLELPRGADVLVPAFIVATYAVEIFPAAPYLVVHSPAPQCGKTRVLEVLQLLVRRPWLTIVPSTAVLFRVLEQQTPTLLLDEAEVVRGRGDAAGDVRALLQSGYRRGAMVPRCVGDANEVRNFRVFGPKVFALIGELPAALFDRCIPIEMQRRPRGPRPERFHPVRLEPEALALRRQARRWVSDHTRELREADPAQLEVLEERQQEVWDPLFAIGLVAGGSWYDRLVKAAHSLSGGREPTSLGLTLLADLRIVFGVARQLPSAQVVQVLNAMEGRPWAELGRGKGLTPNALARLLKPFGVAPTSDGDVRGYRAERLRDVWAQYLPVQASERQESSSDATILASANRQPNVSADGRDSPEKPHDSGLFDGLTDQDTGSERGDAWEPES